MTAWACEITGSYSRDEFDTDETFQDVRAALEEHGAVTWDGDRFALVYETPGGSKYGAAGIAINLLTAIFDPLAVHDHYQPWPP